MDRSPRTRRSHSPSPGHRRSGAARAPAPRAAPQWRDGPRSPPAARTPRTVPGLDSFWLEADRESSAEHPIERELGHRLDVLARYGEQIEGALAEGRDRAAEILLRQREREEAIVRRLRQALRRTSGSA